MADADAMKLVDQLACYQSCGLKIKEDLLDGDAVVLFAYGLSGSGKTFTVFGPDAADAPVGYYCLFQSCCIPHILVTGSLVQVGRATRPVGKEYIFTILMNPDHRGSLSVYRAFSLAWPSNSSMRKLTAGASP
jgi:hypothetical protein